MIGDELAFPHSEVDHYEKVNNEICGIMKFNGGMTIRQYFVAQAMAGLMNNNLGRNFFNKKNLRDLPRWAVSYADACLAAEAETRK